ncbi:MAG: tRNA (guanosine(46)-N7)-methyltransferase TrmB [Sinobacteraceae bacterium]|nr:tRNA (guanosine(46)-N7)-methyltransferase TrmB [Nevskiaceae bacterium]
MQPAATLDRRRQVRSFVRREGRITPAQRAALERLWPRYGIDFDGTVLAPVAVFGRAAPLVLEIGFGNGETLVARAKAEPDKNFLGVEVHRPGVGRLLLSAEALGLENLRTVCHDAAEVLRAALPEASLDEVLIYFPDPWPKKRHHKRRLIQPEFARLLASRLKPDGVLRLATDWADYAEHMRVILNAEPLLRNESPHGGFVARHAARAATKFERRGQRLGHPVFDLAYRRVR